MRSGSFSSGPFLAEERAVGEIDVEPAVVVVIEEGDAGAFGFDDVGFVVGIAPDVGSGESGFSGDVEKLDGRFCGVGRRVWFERSLEQERGFPTPERSAEGVEEGGAKESGGVGEEAAAGRVHRAERLSERWKRDFSNPKGDASQERSGRKSIALLRSK
jgi:hypothetical protein